MMVSVPAADVVAEVVVAAWVAAEAVADFDEVESAAAVPVEVFSPFQLVLQLLLQRWRPEVHPLFLARGILLSVCVEDADIFRGNSSCGTDSLVLDCFAAVPVVVPASQAFLLPWHVKFGQIPEFKSTVIIGVWRHHASIQPQKPGK